MVQNVQVAKQHAEDDMRSRPTFMCTSNILIDLYSYIFMSNKVRSFDLFCRLLPFCVCARTGGGKW